MTGEQIPMFEDDSAMPLPFAMPTPESTTTIRIALPEVGPVEEADADTPLVVQMDSRSGAAGGAMSITYSRNALDEDEVEKALAVVKSLI